MKNIKINKIVLILLILVFVKSVSAEVCKMKPMDPITDVRWNCVLPLTVGSVPLGTSGHPLADKMDKGIGSHSPVCICKIPLPRVGITLKYREPFRVIETTTNAFCFPMLGFGINPTLLNKGVKKPEQNDEGSGNSDAIKVHTHFWISPFFLMFNIASDIGCLSYDNSFTSLALGYVSEIDPTKNSSLLANILQPEALLFANPFAQLACIASGISTLIEYDIPFLFWCIGGAGNTYPLSNFLERGSNPVQSMHVIAARLIYFMHRNLQLFGTYGNQGLCGFFPQPIWNKNQYRLQNAQPIPHWHCTRMGQTGLLWSWAKDPAGVPGSTDMSWIVWRNVNCCFL